MSKWIFLFLCLSVCGCSVFAQARNSLMLTHGQSLLGVDYMANTLDQGDVEELFTDCTLLDCTTFVEVCMAMTLASDSCGNFSEDDYANELRRIRYRNGELMGYVSRLHYIADWITDNEKMGIIEDVTAAHSATTSVLHLSYMSTHPQSYRLLSHSPENVAFMAEVEKKLSGTTYHWLPKSDLPHEGLPWIKGGDIVFLTTNIEGLDVTHAGIAIYCSGQLHLLHASSLAKKVIVSKESLRHELYRSKRTTGIRVVRLN